MEIELLLIKITENGVHMDYHLLAHRDIYKNVTTPIGTIVILRQSNENSIKKLNKLEAFRYIYSETTINSWHKGLYKYYN